MPSPVETIIRLRTVPLFARLDNAQLLALAEVVTEEKHDPDETIVREGECDGAIFFVINGSLSVTRGKEGIATIDSGEFFGEMALLENAPRSATVTTASPCRLLKLERGDLLRLMRELPGISIAMCQTLTGRLREITQRLSRQ